MSFETSATPRQPQSNGPSSTQPRTEYVWRPQPGPQKALVDCPLPEIFFGGARGGGKTDGVLGKWALKERRYGSAFNAIMFRRTTVSSEDAIERAKEIFLPLGAKFIGAPIPRFRMPNGGRVSFAYLDNEDDAQEYQGRNVSDVWIEEAGQYPDPSPIDRLFGVLRSKSGVPTQMILTANPGGAGQQWISSRYGLVPFPLGPKVVPRVDGEGVHVHDAAVIPSRITDNQILLAGDPQYINRMRLVGSAQLVKAWLDGDWSAIEGAFFECWSEARHVLEPFTIPAHWTRICGFDWGSASPFSVGWWAVASEEVTRPEGTILPGALVRYREWYGASGPNRGLKMMNEDIAQGIIDREKGETISARVADPAIFAQDGGPSINEQFGRKGVYWMEADNKRVPRAGAIGGWGEMRGRMIGQDGTPMLFVFRTCREFIRTVPTLQHDRSNAENIDTDMEDHIADETRYVCMARPWAATPPESARKRDAYSPRRGANNWKTG